MNPTIQRVGEMNPTIQRVGEMNPCLMLKYELYIVAGGYQSVVILRWYLFKHGGKPCTTSVTCLVVRPRVEPGYSELLLVRHTEGIP
jgi:hypothetical protein